MIRGVGKEVCARFREERRPAAISLGEDNLVEEHDGGIGEWFGFSLVDKFIEA